MATLLVGPTHLETWTNPAPAPVDSQKAYLTRWCHGLLYVNFCFFLSHLLHDTNSFLMNLVYKCLLQILSHISDLTLKKKVDEIMQLQ